MFENDSMQHAQFEQTASADAKVCGSRRPDRIEIYETDPETGQRILVAWDEAGEFHMSPEGDRLLARQLDEASERRRRSAK